MTVVAAINNIIGKLVVCDPDSRNVVSDLLSFSVEGAENVNAFQIGVWNGKKTFLRPDDSFEAGFIEMIRRGLRERGIPLTVKDYRPTVEIKAEASRLTGIQMRDYQIEACKAFLDNIRGVLRLATGSGKTECAIWITAYLGIPTLFLTHKIDLVKQTAERFEKRLGRKVGWISEGEWMPGDITIASVQTIRSHWDLWWRVEGATQAYAGAPLKQAGKTVQAANQADAIEIAKSQGLVEVHKINLVRDDSQKVEQFLRSRQLVICDEAHRVSGNTFFRIMKGCLEATYRLGLTATPLMKESREDNLKLIAACGDIVYTITNKQLIDLGVLAQPKFRFFEAPMPPLVRRTTAYQRAYNLGIVRNDIRNAMVIDQAIELKDHKPIVLVQREEHGQILKLMAERRGAKVLWISGTTGKGKQKAAMRRQALDALRDGKVDFLIASTIFDEGLDEASIGAIILAGGNKSAISLYQRVGRGSRLKQCGRAQEAIIVDFIDVGNEHLRRHADERFKTVKEEEGWIVQEVDAWHENKRSPLLAPYAGMLNPVGVFPELAKFTGSE